MAEKDMKFYKHREWKPGADAAPEARPVKLMNSEEAAKHASPTNSTGGSAWNSAGTWEERSQKTWAEGHLKKLLVGLTANHEGYGEVRVSELAVTGDASVTFTRGKKKFPFDFSLEVQLSLHPQAQWGGGGRTCFCFVSPHILFCFIHTFLHTVYDRRTGGRWHEVSGDHPGLCVRRGRPVRDGLLLEGRQGHPEARGEGGGRSDSQAGMPNTFPPPPTYPPSCLLKQQRHPRRSRRGPACLLRFTVGWRSGWWTSSPLAKRPHATTHHHNLYSPRSRHLDPSLRGVGRGW